MTLPDNRIRLSSAKIDFETEVGVASQDHDTYPESGGQARFDHMRMYLIGLLSQQSSFLQPAQKRDGTPWFDLNTLSLKIWRNGTWELYSDAIPLEIDGETIVTLRQWYQSVSGTLESLVSELFFAGTCTLTGVSDITIPVDIRSQIYSDSRAFVFVNGQSIDPREVQFVGSPNPTILRLLTVELEANDTFTVSIRRIPSSSFMSTNVVVP